MFADGAAMGKAQLDILRDELEDARGEISSLIGQIEGVREDLITGERWAPGNTTRPFFSRSFCLSHMQRRTPARSNLQVAVPSPVLHELCRVVVETKSSVEVRSVPCPYNARGGSNLYNRCEV